MVSLHGDAVLTLQISLYLQVHHANEIHKCSAVMCQVYFISKECATTSENGSYGPLL